MRCRSPDTKPFQHFTQNCDKSLLLLDCDRFARTLSHAGRWRDARTPPGPRIRYGLDEIRENNI
jgi:hypothetical protein